MYYCQCLFIREMKEKPLQYISCLQIEHKSEKTKYASQLDKAPTLSVGLIFNHPTACQSQRLLSRPKLKLFGMT